MGSSIETVSGVIKLFVLHLMEGDPDSIPLLMAHGYWGEWRGSRSNELGML